MVPAALFAGPWDPSYEGQPTVLYVPLWLSSRKVRSRQVFTSEMVRSIVEIN